MTSLETVFTLQGMTPATRKRLQAASITERNRAICDAYRENASLREIAAIVEMTHAGVRKIIKREQDGQ